MEPSIRFRNSVWPTGCKWVRGSPKGLNTELVEDTAPITKVLKRWHRSRRRFSGFYIIDEWEPDLGIDSTGNDADLNVRELSEEPALFRFFAGLRSDADEFVKFADEWGLLWNPIKFKREIFLYRAGDIDRVGHSMWAEAAEDWIAEIDRMCRAVRLWDLIDEQDEHSLISFLEQSRKIDGLGFDALYGRQMGKRGVSEEIAREIDRLMLSRKVEDLLRSGNVREAAREELAFMVNDSVMHVFSLMIWPEPHQNWAVNITPECLLDFLWLQFATAIAGGVRYQSCVECGAWFIVAPGRGREDKKFCSDACRMRAYRNRKSQRSP